MHAIPEELSCSQRSLTLSYFESSKRSAQRTMSNQSGIIMWRICLLANNMVYALPEELLHSEGNMTKA